MSGYECLEFGALMERTPVNEDRSKGVVHRTMIAAPRPLPGSVESVSQ